MRKIAGFVFAPLIPGIAYGGYTGYISSVLLVWYVGGAFTLLLGVPFYLLLSNITGLNFWKVSASAAILGVVAAAIFGSFLNPPDITRYMPLFGVFGVSTGISFWFIALYRASPNKALNPQPSAAGTPKSGAR